MVMAFIQNCGPVSIVIVLALILLLFGGKKIPDLARSLGKAKGEFKKGIREGEDEARPKKSAKRKQAKRK